MILFKKLSSLFTGLVLILCPFYLLAQHTVHHSGAMKNVMRQGKLEATVRLDTLINKGVMWGIGPLDSLRGEITIVNGIPFISVTTGVDGMRVYTNAEATAPFLVYSGEKNWKKSVLPKHVKNLASLEAYLDSFYHSYDQPFCFRLEGKINRALIHIVNLPPGQKVGSPEDAHRGMIKYPLNDVMVEMVGFFSRHHQTIYTHHDTFMHLHLITIDKSAMGHLEEVEFDADTITLLVPSKL